MIISFLENLIQSFEILVVFAQLSIAIGSIADPLCGSFFAFRLNTFVASPLLNILMDAKVFLSG